MFCKSPVAVQAAVATNTEKDPMMNKITQLGSWPMNKVLCKPAVKHSLCTFQSNPCSTRKLS